MKLVSVQLAYFKTSKTFSKHQASIIMQTLHFVNTVYAHAHKKKKQTPTAVPW